MPRGKEQPQFSDKRFRSLIEKSFDVVALIDAKARILYASPSIVRLYGRPTEEFMGLSGLKYIYPADYPKILKLLGLLLTRPKESIEVELRIKHKNGDWRWVHAVATNLLADPEIKGIVVNFHDITAQKLNEQRKDEFISIASHELKTPLTSLKLYIQLLKTKDKEQVNEYLEHMDNQIDRLSHLVNELLDVSRISSGKLEIKKQKFNIVDLVKESVEDIQGSNPQKIIIQGQEELPVFADYNHITQVVNNLLSNAIKHSPPASKIVVKCRKNKDQVYVSVRDFGSGISKKDLHQVFEKFFQARDQPQKASGLGLGLYISSVIVEQHGGKIGVKSEEGKGATFTISLPVNNSK